MAGGGGGYIPRSSKSLRTIFEEAKNNANKERLDGDVNQLMRDLLSSYQRDSESIQQHMQEIENVLQEVGDLEKFMFGGSVAKHTYVEGLSDVDAVVLVNKDDFKDENPKSILNQFTNSLRNRLTAKNVDKVEKGNLSVTITFRDKTEIQILPAIRVGKRIAISDETGEKWNDINPKIFQQKLSLANERLNSNLIPTIRLMKTINSKLPKQKQMEGIHIEALTLECLKNYRGSKTPKAMLLYVLDTSSKRVLKPISDISGQTKNVDSGLGTSNSVKRKAIADSLSSISRRLNAATTVNQWKEIVQI